MRTYLTIPKALEQYPTLTRSQLEQLITKGEITTFALEDVQTTQTIIYADDLAAYFAKNLNPDKYKHLQGNLLNLNEAAIKYQISYGTIYRWATSGKLTVREVTKHRKMIDEADIAYIVEITKMQNMRQGKRLI